MSSRHLSIVFALLVALLRESGAFVPATTLTAAATRISALRLSSAQAEAAALLERARKMREEVAALTGESVQDLENESAAKKQQLQAIAEKAAAEREEKKKQPQAAAERSRTQMVVALPDTPDDQISQCKAAVERAFRDGKTRQIVRFALVPEGETINQEDRQWPGGAQQMYREAAGPMARSLLKTVRTSSSDRSSSTEAANAALGKPPQVGSVDIWDFDGSAMVTAQHASASNDVQAMVLPNTDNKYTNEIASRDQGTGDRLFLLVNPFWRNLDSWGVNILAPNAKKLAAAAIFDRGFEETYCVLQKSVRGEDCVAVKAYPYDWQLYAHVETDYWPYAETSVHLGSTPHEPTSVDFSELLAEREEFKLSKNMRQVQRMLNKDEY